MTGQITEHNVHISFRKLGEVDQERIVSMIYDVGFGKPAHIAKALFMAPLLMAPDPQVTYTHETWLIRKSAVKAIQHLIDDSTSDSPGL